MWYPSLPGCHTSFNFFFFFLFSWLCWIGFHKQCSSSTELARSLTLYQRIKNRNQIRNTLKKEKKKKKCITAAVIHNQGICQGWLLSQRATHTQTCPIFFFLSVIIYPLYPISYTHAKDLFFTIELAQSSLDLLVILLHLRQGILNVLQRDLLIWLLGATGFILAGAVVLDLFARFLDLAQAQCCRWSFQEVTQLGEFGEFFFFPASLLGNKHNNI